MEKNELIDIINELPYVPERNYWLIRTYSGAYYNQFVDGNYIAIGWNEITTYDLDLIKRHPNNKDVFNDVKNKIKKHYENERSQDIGQTKTLRQIQKFADDVKQGDIVIIPSPNSHQLTFGEVQSKPIYNATANERMADECDFIKRKKVDWIKENIFRSKLPPSLTGIIYSHSTVSNVNEYKVDINDFLYDFHISKDQKATIVIRLKKEGDIDPFNYQKLYNNILGFMADASEYLGEDLSEKETSVKLQLQSPGTIIIATMAFATIALLGTYMALTGGEGKFEFGKFKAHIKGKGKLLDTLSDFLDRQQNRRFKEKVFDEMMKQFKVGKIKDIERLLNLPPENEINNPDNKPEQ